MVFRRTVALICLVLIFSTTGVRPGSAQGEVGGNVRVSNPDTSAFPATKVRVVALSTGGTLVGGLTADTVRIYEDGAQQPVVASEVAPVLAGAQVAIVFDASGSMNQPGTTARLNKPDEKQTRCDEAKQAIDNLLMTDTWFSRSKKMDRLMVVVPRGPGDFGTSQQWTADYVAANNQIVPFDCAKQKTDTPLYAMLSYSLDHMKDARGYEGRSRFLLIFSDGVDKTSPNNADNIIQQAKDSGVTVLAVRLGPPVTDAVDKLKYMAERTGGAFVGYSGVDSLKPLYSMIQSQATQYAVTYHSAISRSGQHSLVAGVVSGGHETQSAPLTFGIRVEPPAVRITNPASPLKIVRKSDTVGVDPRTIEPRQQQIDVEISWPDGHPRAVSEVSFVVGGTVVGSGTAGQPFTWDFSGLPAGSYSLVAEAKDEQGLTGTSDPLQTKIDVIVPAPPAPVVSVSTFPWLIAAALAIAGLALLLAVYVLIRKPETVQQLGGAIARGAKEITEIFIPRRPGEGAGSSQRPRASLVVLGDGGERGDVYAIKMSTVLIGRDPEQSGIVLPDKTVSKLHARIVEESDAVFRIFDEGSRSGTYVNFDLVPASGRQLVVNDRIQLGRMTLSFEVQHPGQRDATEPYIPQSKGQGTPGKRRPAEVKEPVSGGNHAGVRDRDDTEPFVGRD